ncbi:MAG: cell division protein FtsQ/DivIB [Cetobacterium sp.]|uniref:cell division protein FtsQ/DivIB n=1 Tax=Cetobacterium sp. TaxID=2071632 RepID=UPI003F327F4B
MKWILRVGFLCLLTISLIRVKEELLKKDIFNIKTVNINSISKSLNDDVLPLKNEILGKNIYDIDIDFLKKMLKNDIRIKNVQVTKEGLNQIDISIEEREVAYYAQIRNELYLVDKDGIIFGKLNEQKLRDLPILNVKNISELNDYVKIFSKIEDISLKDMISQVYTQNKHCISLILTDGTVIKTDLMVTREKYSVGETLYLDLIKNKKIEYLDLRFKDFIIKCSGDKDEKK